VFSWIYLEGDAAQHRGGAVRLVDIIQPEKHFLAKEGDLPFSI
jgi:hypothetical protein